MPTNSERINSREDDSEQYESISSRGVIPRAKIKTVKMTFVIVFGCKLNLRRKDEKKISNRNFFIAVFILCYSPYFVWDLLQVYGFIPFTQTTIALSTFIQSLAPLNSAANPLIYFLFSTKLTRNLK
ncbi:cardioacceleratory peptide receptor-like protein [Dinothrombium tinctorium]|uniref:Cardioacceleratory peptide receptor-like protein n=1 Tax=Dinothrombium tinctorium TaxID=1965070 RepID=A0A3S3S0X5_9ACAR|nr:cardioacceleratory peptide receptor-like protein [Dinothrombium tinctorium]RWS07487.1 cardioacceleratory peptide receptor-like protein [Dinothrombium tinctorium]RWS07639.1 cardioacceleratory peptide receptor-like protein [Dinothrombium tinctorium]